MQLNGSQIFVEVLCEQGVKRLHDLNKSGWLIFVSRAWIPFLVIPAVQC